MTKDLLEALIAWMKNTGKKKGFTAEDFDRLVAEWPRYREQFFVAFTPKPKKTARSNGSAKSLPKRTYLKKLEKLANGKPVNEANVKAFINSGGGEMPAYETLMSDGEKDDVIAYLKTL